MGFNSAFKGLTLPAYWINPLPSLSWQEEVKVKVKEFLYRPRKAQRVPGV